MSCVFPQQHSKDLLDSFGIFVRVYIPSKVLHCGSTAETFEKSFLHVFEALAGYNVQGGVSSPLKRFALSISGNFITHAKEVIVEFDRGGRIAKVMQHFCTWER